MKFKDKFYLALVLYFSFFLFLAVKPKFATTTTAAELDATSETLDIATLPPVGTGKISYLESVAPLTPRQERLLLDYMNSYYQSLTHLQVINPNHFFTTTAQDQAVVRDTAWQVITETRRAQATDLSLVGFAYNLGITNWEATEASGEIMVEAKEHITQNFALAPTIGAETFNIRHRFYLQDTADGWKLNNHLQLDSANMLALGDSNHGHEEDESHDESEPNLIDLAQAANQRREEIVAEHRYYAQSRQNQKNVFINETEATKQWDHDYNREAAIVYAKEWVGKRNTNSWAVYDDLGGNCANFVSQALLAGGIPMDYDGGNHWKWYGEDPDYSSRARGRSLSWAGVDEFYDYAANNDGRGLVAQVDANYWLGDVGDVIQLGAAGEWRHSVIISHVIKNEQGETVDYLINSNTADQRNYPVSAYLYPMQRLIKIYGWND